MQQIQYWQKLGLKQDPLKNTQSQSLYMLKSWQHLAGVINHVIGFSEAKALVYAPKASGKSSFATILQQKIPKTIIIQTTEKSFTAKLADAEATKSYKHIIIQNGEKLTDVQVDALLKLSKKFTIILDKACANENIKKLKNCINFELPILPIDDAPNFVAHLLKGINNPNILSRSFIIKLYKQSEFNLGRFKHLLKLALIEKVYKRPNYLSFFQKYKVINLISISFIVVVLLMTISNQVVQIKPIKSINLPNLSKAYTKPISANNKNLLSLPKHDNAKLKHQPLNQFVILLTEPFNGANALTLYSFKEQKQLFGLGFYRTKQAALAAIKEHNLASYRPWIKTIKELLQQINMHE